VKLHKRMVNLRENRCIKTIITAGHLVWWVRRLIRLAIRIIDSRCNNNSIIFKITIVRLDIKVRIAKMISKTVNLCLFFLLHSNELLQMLSSLLKEYRKLNKSGKVLSMDWLLRFRNNNNKPKISSATIATAAASLLVQSTTNH